MDSLAPNRTPSNPLFQPEQVQHFFQTWGELELYEAGKKIFSKPKIAFLPFRSQKLYLLLQGELTLQSDFNEPITLESGELFGEFTHYHADRFTATAQSSCQLLSLTEKQLLEGLKKSPNFMFLMMAILVKPLRQVESENSATTEQRLQSKKIGLSTELLTQLQQIVGSEERVAIPDGQLIFQEGHAAMLMYVILEGHAVIYGEDRRPLWRGKRGDVLGEIALIDQNKRTASVIAESRCLLLPISRQKLINLIQTLPAFSVALLRVLASRSYLPRTLEDYAQINRTITVQFETSPTLEPEYDKKGKVKLADPEKPDKWRVI